MAKKRKLQRNAKNYMLPHSEAKVEMYSKYLEKYIKILARNPFIDTINIIDVFCGTGIYENGKKGSPIKAYELILEDIKLLEKSGKKPKKVQLIINDVNKDNVDKVKSYIHATFPKHEQLVDMYGNRDAVKLFPQIIDWLKNQKKSKNLLFIDPYGYKEIQSSIINDLMKNGNTEIVLFLPINQMQRFSRVAQEDEENKSYEKLRSFISQFFSSNHPIRMGEKINNHDYIRYVKEAFSFDNAYYTTSYYIQRNKSNYYALFFITSHIYGLDKILETKWTLDKLEGRGFQLNQPIPFGINRLEKTLKQFVLNNLRTNADLYRFVLIQEHLPIHAAEILKKWDDKGKLVDEHGIKVKSGSKTYYMNYTNYKNYQKTGEVKLKFKLIE
jgi:three-Cys-motif partner protein